MRWSIIDDTDERYLISDTGVVLDVVKNRLTGLWKDKDGYLLVSLPPKNNKRRHLRVHRLVAIAFIPNVDNLPVINHIDYDKCNNTISNLEWCDMTYNTRHSFKRKGKRGAYWNKQAQAYSAQIKIKGQHFFLGNHSNIEDAYTAFYNKYVELTKEVPW